MLAAKYGGLKPKKKGLLAQVRGGDDGSVPSLRPPGGCIMVGLVQLHLRLRLPTPEVDSMHATVLGGEGGQGTAGALGPSSAQFGHSTATHCAPLWLQDKKYFDSAEWAMKKEQAARQGAPAPQPELPPKLEPTPIPDRRVSHLDPLEK